MFQGVDFHLNVFLKNFKNLILLNLIILFFKSNLLRINYL
ncbi:hypothetical protein BbiDN127_0422 [Borreliella bissettiae DN127]|uniref:Uncharacterized protein n=1 Tax=Borrelia bissettiae (strain DSM 17990 / CIP 109136 / DN127) TaxID=521010 RepID=G0ALM2_BORBD|nr:hypothetical protein BbiDN127_0422 [Borreliella bissettiae DN127]